MTDSKLVQTVDVLIVGAGVAGIGFARHLQKKCPNHSFAVLESRSNIGGTWDLFRYPGIRSDSDMYTFSYGFKPWTGAKSLGRGELIREYVTEVAAESGIDRNIHFQHQVVNASWCSKNARWTVTAHRKDTDETVQFECNFLMMCCGYYDYEQGYTPEFTDREKFQGEVIHPQHWPEDLDYTGKRVVVIGSGATAITLVPELAKKTAHTIMLQRSPTYIASVPAEDPLGLVLRKFLPRDWAVRVTRWKQMFAQFTGYQVARTLPGVVRKALLSHAQSALGNDYDIEKHFTPKYNPWEQRVCSIPDNDLFNAIREQHAEVVTDQIERFTETGISLASGNTIEADIIVVATGLKMKYLGGATVTVDGKEMDLPSQYVYRSTMLTNLPNLGQVFGYVNSSWTLKAELISQYVCRLLNHMHKHNRQIAVPRADSENLHASPYLDLSSGYVSRGIQSFPKQGNSFLWRIYQNYYLDYIALRLRPIRDKVLELR